MVIRLKIENIYLPIRLRKKNLIFLQYAVTKGEVILLQKIMELKIKLYKLVLKFKLFNLILKFIPIFKIFIIILSFNLFKFFDKNF